MKVLLHSCCAPCAGHCVLALRRLGHEVVLFFRNDNIAPRSEFKRRLESMEELGRQLNVPLIVDEPDHDGWLREVAADYEGEREGGERCARCFRYSLERTWRRMLQEGMDLFTTTLTVSPHKHSQTIFEIGMQVSAMSFISINFKKQDGFKQSLQLARSHGFYRQSYCGCEFSLQMKAAERGSGENCGKGSHNECSQP